MSSSDSERMTQAIQFLYENPDEKHVTAARIYKVNEHTLRSKIRRADQTTNTHGGHNKILTAVQIKAIQRYVADSYYAGYGASRSMVLSAIGHLKAAELPPQKPPSLRWFQGF